MSAVVHDIWTGVRERVLALRTAPHRQDVFGAEFGSFGHGFELLPVLDEAQVAEIERQLGVRLPDEYRTFLLRVGAGGAGPDYGVLPVGRLDDDAFRASRIFRPEATRELTEHEESEPVAHGYDDWPAEEQERFRQAYADWGRRWDELSDNLSDGTLCVSEQGCGYYTLLALTGEARGTMWDDVRAVGHGVVPVRFTRSGDDPNSLVSYADWYLRWLEHAERTACGGRPPEP
ncbi:SMI1/KNR4 family protein [Streptomyces sp. Da 82-17]|uniref:SMI1/KNR4 family protein n=1 Tax=Streptomyces sp. Da 82-17 TaxID=3377116 RepID=UPI0038D3AD29